MLSYVVLSVSGGSFFKGIKTEFIQQLTISYIKRLKSNGETVSNCDFIYSYETYTPVDNYQPVTLNSRSNHESNCRNERRR